MRDISSNRAHETRSNVAAAAAAAEFLGGTFETAWCTSHDGGRDEY